MYYYEIIEQNVVAITKPDIPYGSDHEADVAAMDFLATYGGVVQWPAEIRVFTGDSFYDKYVIRWHNVYQDEVNQHAVKRIKEANRPALTDVVLRAQENHETLEDRYMRGLITPTEYAKAEHDMWALVVYEIENIEARR